MGMDKQRTTRVRRITKEAHNGTGYGPLQPRGTHQDRNRRIKIRLLRYPVATMRRWKMEASGLPIKDDARRRMQLRHPRQGTVSRCPSTQRMEKIHERKPETNSSLHRP